MDLSLPCTISAVPGTSMGTDRFRARKRSLRWVILPIVLIQVTLLWTRGILGLTEMKLSMVSSMLTSLVTIIGVATTMHITVTFREFRQTLGRRESYLRTFGQLAHPIAWTCLTTAVGFAALLSSRIVPVRRNNRTAYCQVVPTPRLNRPDPYFPRHDPRCPRPSIKPFAEHHYLPDPVSAPVAQPRRIACLTLAATGRAPLPQARPHWAA